MDTKRVERQVLPELIKLFENPSATATKYFRLARFSFAVGAAALVTAAILAGAKIADGLKEILLIVGGGAFTAGTFYRFAARQIPVMIKYTEFRLQEARETLQKAQMPAAIAASEMPARKTRKQAMASGDL